MKVLVTGATGFLGTALCRTLTAAGDEVVGLGSAVCDLTRQGTLDPWNGSTFDRIFHLAAWTQAGDFCLHHLGEQWVINQQINTNVLAWWHSRQPQAQLIAIGTSCAYAPDLELVENHYFTGLPIESLFTYAMTKRMLHAGVLALSKQYGLRAAHRRPLHVVRTGLSTRRGGRCTSFSTSSGRLSGEKKPVNRSCCGGTGTSAGN